MPNEIAYSRASYLVKQTEGATRIAIQENKNLSYRALERRYNYANNPKHEVKRNKWHVQLLNDMVSLLNRPNG
jgi:hypothetical protein